MGKSKRDTLAEDVSLPSRKAAKSASQRVDPALEALFQSSTPRAPPSLPKHSTRRSQQKDKEAEELSEISEVLDDFTEEEEASPLVDVEPSQSRKRKRGNQDEEIEDRYLNKLALEELKENETKKKQKKDKTQQAIERGSDSESSSSEEDLDAVETPIANGDAEEEEYEIPKHETLTVNGAANELEKAARTVFLGNVSTSAIKSKSSKKVLLDYLGSFFSKMKDSSDQRVESIRFRSTAFSDGSLPKKAAFAKRELMDATTQSTNAYVVYSTTSAAREAVKHLNGTIVLDRHLRVDSVAHPSAVDHRRCVFVGNLGFVDDESNIRANEADDGERRPKAKVPADVEEGLWVHFAKAGPVESVRVVRDRNTRVGKGIAYVQFKDPNSVEKALSFHDKKFPPMLPRKLRVTRAKKFKKSTMISGTKQSKSNDSRIYKPKQSAHLLSLAGRANKLLGRGGGYHVRKKAKSGDASFKSQEDIVFEGHRAVPNNGSKTSKEGKKKKPKRVDRRTSRSLAYRAGGSSK